MRYWIQKILKYGAIKKDDLKNFGADPQGLWQELIKNGLINERGFLQGPTRERGPDRFLKLDQKYINHQEKIALHLRKTYNRAVIREWIESIIIALVLALFIRAFIIQAFKIPSGSMRMTLIEGDRILVSKYRYGPKIPFTKNLRLPGISHPQRGEVIVFRYPEDPNRDFIKRLIAVGGEEIEIKDGRILINNQVVKDPRIYIVFYYNFGEYARTNQRFRIPENSYFVLGDNSASSKDSRYWGFVPHDMIVGRAEVIYWPPQRIRFIK